MRRLLFAALALWASSAASAFTVGQEAVNEFVRQRLAQSVSRDLQVLNPRVALLEGKASICATVYARLLPNEVDFCAELTPQWRPATGSLLATKMVLVSLAAPGYNPHDIELLKSLVNQIVLPGLEGVEVYRADNFIGQQISWLRVSPGQIDFGF